MRHFHLLWVTIAAVLYIATPGSLLAHPGTHYGESVQETSSRFLNHLNDEQKEKTQFSMDHSARTDWSYFPGSRAGISLSDLKNEQRRSVHRILQSGLSEKGYNKVNNIIHIEKILGEMEGNPNYKAGMYFTAIFGNPGKQSPWNLRFEGHHLSLNYALVDGEVVSVTPAFFGANPAVVPEGPFAGKETLVREQQLARTLIHSLDNPVREKAIFRSEAYQEIVTEQEEKAELSSFKGVPMSSMGKRNQAMLKQLIHVYTGNFPDEHAAKLTASFLDAKPDRIYFGWAGGTKPGEPHYYRIHAPEILIEYDNVQDGANHIHTVIRSFDGDFGRDVLSEHYQNSPHHEDGGE